jgi:hypothetical protein
VADLWFGSAQPGQQRRGGALRGLAKAAGDQQGIQLGRGAVAPGALGDQLKAGGGGHRSGFVGQHQQAIGLGLTLAAQLDVGRGEHLQRAGDVQAHHVRVDQAGNGLHGANLQNLERVCARRLLATRTIIPQILPI